MLNIAKLKWRSRRSTLELDIYFDRFIQSNALEGLNKDELEIYAKIISFEDTELALLFQGLEVLQDEKEQAIINKIINCGI